MICEIVSNISTSGSVILNLVFPSFPVGQYQEVLGAIKQWGTLKRKWFAIFLTFSIFLHMICEIVEYFHEWFCNPEPGRSQLPRWAVSRSSWRNQTVVYIEEEMVCYVFDIFHFLTYDM